MSAFKCVVLLGFATVFVAGCSVNRRPSETDVTETLKGEYGTFVRVEGVQKTNGIEYQGGNGAPARYMVEFKAVLIPLAPVTFQLSSALEAAATGTGGVKNGALIKGIIQGHRPDPQGLNSFFDISTALRRLDETHPANVVGGVLFIKTDNGWLKERIQTFLTDGTAAPARKEADVKKAEQGAGRQFVKISPGEFLMGCSTNDTECRGEEKPTHRVRLTKGFEMGKYEVTQAAWRSVMGSNPSHFKGNNRPVESVSWNDAQAFIGKLNAHQDGYRYRLPTEAEWEYAARAGTKGAYAGSLSALAWYDQNSGEQTHPVGQKQPNAWGLYDMHGNVWEWVQDWYDFKLGTGDTVVDPVGPSEGQGRVLRGGSIFCGRLRGNPRVSARIGNGQDQRNIAMGFRLVRESTR